MKLIHFLWKRLSEIIPLEISDRLLLISDKTPLVDVLLFSGLIGDSRSDELPSVSGRSVISSCDRVQDFLVEFKAPISSICDCLEQTLNR